MIKVGEAYNLAVPRGINEALLRVGGINRFGGPRYRCVWGYSRCEWQAGEFNDFDEKTGVFVRKVNEVRWEPRYAKPNRFYFEAWQPPETYGTPDDWYAETFEMTEKGESVQTLGPYPTLGDYESVWICESPGAIASFLWPTVEIAERVPLMHQRSKERTRIQIRNDIKEHADKKAAQQHQVIEDMARDMILDSSIVPRVALSGHELPFKKGPDGNH